MKKRKIEDIFSLEKKTINMLGVTLMKIMMIMKVEANDDKYDDSDTD